MPVKDTRHAVSIANDLMKRFSAGKAVLGDPCLVDALQHLSKAALERERLVEVNTDLRIRLNGMEEAASSHARG